MNELEKIEKAKFGEANNDIAALKKAEGEIPKTATCNCPLKEYKSRYIVKGCLNCDNYKGLTLLTDAIETPIKDRVTGQPKLDGEGNEMMRPLQWHEKYLVRCAYPTTRRCANIEIVED